MPRFLARVKAPTRREIRNVSHSFLSGFIFACSPRRSPLAPLPAGYPPAADATPRKTVASCCPQSARTRRTRGRGRMPAQVEDVDYAFPYGLAVEGLAHRHGLGECRSTP